MLSMPKMYSTVKYFFKCNPKILTAPLFQVDHENEFDWEDAQNVPEYNVTKEDTDSIYEHPSFETFRQWSLNNIPVNPQQGKPMRRAGDRKGRRAKINEMTNKRRHARRRKAIDDAINVAFLTLWIKKMLTVRRQILEFMHHKQQQQWFRRFKIRVYSISRTHGCDSILSLILTHIRQHKKTGTRLVFIGT